jgi:hypothetical protein
MSEAGGILTVADALSEREVLARSRSGAKDNRFGIMTQGSGTLVREAGMTERERRGPIDCMPFPLGRQIHG